MATTSSGGREEEAGQARCLANPKACPNPELARAAGHRSGREKAGKRIRAHPQHRARDACSTSGPGRGPWGCSGAPACCRPSSSTSPRRGTQLPTPFLQRSCQNLLGAHLLRALAALTQSCLCCPSLRGDRRPLPARPGNASGSVEPAVRAGDERHDAGSDAGHSSYRLGWFLDFFGLFSLCCPLGNQ